MDKLCIQHGKQGDVNVWQRQPVQETNFNHYESIFGKGMEGDASRG